MNSFSQENQFSPGNRGVAADTDHSALAKLIRYSLKKGKCFAYMGVYRSYYFRCSKFPVTLQCLLILVAYQENIINKGPPSLCAQSCLFLTSALHDVSLVQASSFVSCSMHELVAVHTYHGIHQPLPTFISRSIYFSIFHAAH